VASFYTPGGEGGRCASFDVGVRSTMDVLRVVKLYYETDFANKVQQPTWDVWHNLPVIHTSNSTQCFSRSKVQRDAVGEAGFFEIASDQQKWGPFIFESLLFTLHHYAPWVEDGLACFFRFSGEDEWTIGNLLRDSMVCKFDNVMFCGKQVPGKNERFRRNLFVCLVISFAIWYAVGFMLSCIPGAGVFNVMLYSFMWILVPVTAIQISYGVGIACFPMIPTCMVQDLIVTVNDFLPVNITWPNALQRYPGCVDKVKLATGSSTEAASQCLLSCRGDPFYFTTWEHSLSWMLCSLDPDGCTNISVPYAPLVMDASWNYSEVNQYAVSKNATGMDVWRAHQYCFFVTLAQGLPWFLVWIVLIYLLVSLVYLPIPLLPAGVQFMVQALCFTHAD
jgi:hypothetical protein